MKQSPEPVEPANPLGAALRALPDFDPPAEGWQRVDLALRPALKRRRRWPLPMLLAASLTGMAVLVGVQIQSTPSTDDGLQAVAIGTFAPALAEDDAFVLALILALLEDEGLESAAALDLTQDGVTPDAWFDPPPQRGRLDMSHPVAKYLPMLPLNPKRGFLMNRFPMKTWMASAVLSVSLLAPVASAAPGARADEPAAVTEARQQLRDAARRYSATLEANGLPAHRGYAGHRKGGEKGKPSRGALGLRLAPAEAGGNGLAIRSVMPESGAAAAGLQPGDVLTAVNGVKVGDANSPGNWRATLKDLQPGDRIQISFLRDGRAQSAEITASERRAGPHRYGQGAGKRSWRLETMNAELAPYFGGQTSGVLVLRAPEHRGLGLLPGDIITRVGETAVESPRDLMRGIWRGEGDTVALTVLRQGAVMALNAERPTARGGKANGS